MNEVALITDKYRRTGFQLANIHNVFSVNDGYEALRQARKLVGENYGIILITDTVAPMDEPDFVVMLKQAFPAIIVMPTGYEQLDHDHIRNIEALIQQSVGLSVKL